jgi:hypothetical protein
MYNTHSYFHLFCFFCFSILHEDVFAGLQNVVDLSFSDNILLDVPSHILRRMPYVELIDLSRNRITSLTADDLKVSAR